jgi:hypothetical protein
LQPDDLFSYRQQPAIHVKLVTRGVAVIEDVLAEAFRLLIGCESAKICIESEAIIADIARFCPRWNSFTTRAAVIFPAVLLCERL